MDNVCVKDIDMMIIKELIDISENYYPELTYKIIINNLPSNVSKVLNSILKLLCAETRAKITISN